MGMMVTGQEFFEAYAAPSPIPCCEGEDAEAQQPQSPANRLITIRAGTKNLDTPALNGLNILPDIPKKN
jgi:hypothetical protein